MIRIHLWQVFMFSSFLLHEYDQYQKYKLEKPSTSCSVDHRKRESYLSHLPISRISRISVLCLLTINHRKHNTQKPKMHLFTHQKLIHAFPNIHVFYQKNYLRKLNTEMWSSGLTVTPKVTSCRTELKRFLNIRRIHQPSKCQSRK